YGEFDIDAPGVVGGRVAVKEGGNVGIGVPNPSQLLSVAGTIESTAGGFKFSCGSTQNTPRAVDKKNLPPPANFALTNSLSTVLTLTIPEGTYLVEAALWVSNSNNDPFSNNTRSIRCALIGPNEVQVGLIGLQSSTFAFHDVLPISSGHVDLSCA